MDPRLDTGGWLTLSRRGLPPRKIRRASPGAITPAVTGAFVVSAANGKCVRVYGLVSQIIGLRKTSHDISCNNAHADL